MAKKETKLIWLVVALLAIGIIAGLFLDPSVRSALQSTGDYNIQITEICAKNENILADNDGKYRDYIELYNAGGDVDLTGCRLTDGTTTVTPFEGVTMAAGEYRVVFLGKETVGFALSSSGRDSIQLQDPNGDIIAQAKVQSLSADQVMLLQNGTYRLSSTPSPGFANTDKGVKAFREGAHAVELPIRINEVLIANQSALPDEKGVFSDVVELYNPGTKAIRLSGWAISDSTRERFRYRLPDVTIPAGHYLVLFCDGENYVAQDGQIHTNFALTAGEELCLTDPNGTYVTLKLQYIAENMSLGFDESDYVSMGPSLGYPNTDNGRGQFETSRINEGSALVISEVLLSDAGVPFGGQFIDAVELHNRSSQTVSTAGWYLSDGGDAYAFPLPQQELAPGEYVTYPISRKDSGFGLALDETLYLMGPDFRLAPPVVCVEPPMGSSISLVGTEEGFSYDFLPITLGYANGQTGAEAFASDCLTDDLRITEVMSSNSSYLMGPYGNATDWVELYNAGSTTIDLSQYCLTDSSDLGKYPLPDKTLAPGKYFVILLSETGKNLRSGYSHLPFNLSSSGDRLYLTKDNAIVDYTVIPELSGNEAWGRPAGKPVFDLLSDPTPGSGNSGAANISQTPTADLPQGAYDNVSSITVSFSGTGEIYYTTDCTAPSRSSRRYTGPITITETTVFRVAAYESGASRSEILNLTYLVNENDSLSSVCLVTEPYNLWDYNYGIYVDGPNKGETYPYQGANYWRNWERSGSVALFEEDGSLGFYEPCGLKIFGGYSRANGKKSFACMFRGKYGASSLDYPLFGEKGIDCYQSFVLRAGGQDAYMAKIRDEVITSLANDYLGLPVQQYRPVTLYLNGEFWGIYFIREKLTEQYVAANFNVHAEDVILDHWSGDTSEYLALQYYARSHDLTKQENYDYILSQINEDNYTDYVITQMWIQNMDLGNVKFFRTDDLEWHWALFDTDLSLMSPSSDSVRYNLYKSNIWSFDFMSRVVIIKLLKNPEFRDNFIRRIAYQVNTVWNEETVVARIDYFQNLLQPDMAKECRRWGGSVGSWEKYVENLRVFARKRNNYFIPDVQSFFGLTDQEMRDYGFEV